MSNKLPICRQWDGKSYDIFCAKCYRQERFFSGGGSWTPDLCSCGCEDTLVWYKMGVLQKRKAQKKYDEDLIEWQRKNL
jgi:hypothetical protein